MVVAAVRHRKHVDGPVKVVWTREEDIQHDVYSSVYRDTICREPVRWQDRRWKYRVSGRRSWRAAFSSGFQNGLDIDAVIAPSTCPTMFPISMSNTSGPAARRCRRFFFLFLLFFWGVSLASPVRDRS